MSSSEVSKRASCEDASKAIAVSELRKDKQRAVDDGSALCALDTKSFCCPICLEDFTLSTGVLLTTCKEPEPICNACMKDYIVSAIRVNGRGIITCPLHTECEPIEYHVVKNYLESDEYLLEQYHNLSLREWMVQQQAMRYCPSGCGFAALGCSQEPRMECLKCQTAFCFFCRGLYHTGACKRTKKAKLGEQVKPCPQCGILIYKDEGCNSVKCQHCEHKFCWLCRKQIEGEVHFLGINSCTLNGKRRGFTQSSVIGKTVLIATAPILVGIVAAAAVPSITVGLPLKAVKNARKRSRDRKMTDRKRGVKFYAKHTSIVAASIVGAPIAAATSAAVLAIGGLGYLYGVTPLQLMQEGIRRFKAKGKSTPEEENAETFEMIAEEPLPEPKD
eukprot:Colp12_sorted_trinity150504_noHs@36401